MCCRWKIRSGGSLLTRRARNYLCQGGCCIFLAICLSVCKISQKSYKWVFDKIFWWDAAWPKTQRLDFCGDPDHMPKFFILLSSFFSLSFFIYHRHYSRVSKQAGTFRVHSTFRTGTCYYCCQSLLPPYIAQNHLSFADVLLRNCSFTGWM